jgi:CRISPR/Cas system CMR subunit Cmr4 (Cas7 group RAMP superfamily)
MSPLITPERLTLEILSEKPRTLNELSLELGMSLSVCQSILQTLKAYDLITTNGVIYRIHPDYNQQYLKTINESSAKRFECIEMLESMVMQKNESKIRLRKISMDERDEKIFHALLNNLESFLQEAEKKALKKRPMHERRVVVWGSAAVSEIMDGFFRGE